MSSKESSSNLILFLFGFIRQHDHTSLKWKCPGWNCLMWLSANTAPDFPLRWQRACEARWCHRPMPAVKLWVSWVQSSSALHTPPYTPTLVHSTDNRKPERARWSEVMPGRGGRGSRKGHSVPVILTPWHAENTCGGFSDGLMKVFSCYVSSFITFTKVSSGCLLLFVQNKCFMCHTYSADTEIPSELIRSGASLSV